MKKYFGLQLKRALKVSPFVLAVTVILLVGLTTVLSGVLRNFSNSQEQQKFKIGITGDTDNEYMQWGMVAVQTLDESKFSMEFLEMSEADAQKALSGGQISAYVILPEDFVDRAIEGDMEPITYVTSAGMEGLVSMFKKEVTKLITDMVVYSQKGAYALSDVLVDNGHAGVAGKHVQTVSLQYTDLILHRDELYSLEELGVANGLSLEEYFLCAIAVLLLAFVGLPFVTVYVKQDHSLCRLLCSRGYSPSGQLACEFGVHLLSMLVQAGAICLVTGVGLQLMPELMGGLLGGGDLGEFAFRLIPVVILFAAFNIMVFELSDNVVSGVLLHFFATVSLCYISGCMYPIYAFPKTVQQIAVFLPTGLARGYLAAGFTSASGVYELLGMLAYALAFFGIALTVRLWKTANKRGG